MHATRTTLVIVTVCGIAAALWYARPDDPTEPMVWLFSLFTSLAWLLAGALCILATRFKRPAIAIGGVIALGLSELFICLNARDPFFLLVKPFLQTFVLAVGAAIGFPFGRRTEMTPNTSFERTRGE
jgi:hypothetical protein